MMQTEGQNNVYEHPNICVTPVYQKISILGIHYVHWRFASQDRFYKETIRDYNEIKESIRVVDHNILMAAAYNVQREVIAGSGSRP